jgi:RNA polymerase sigma factor (TIGR02999 family)
VDANESTLPTRLLRSVADGEPDAVGALTPTVYAELHRIAGAVMRSAPGNHTLQPTELIHEAYLRLIDRDAEQWQGRLHFTRVAARAMRFVLVDRARAATRQKRGGVRRRVTLDTQLAAVADHAESVLFVHDGLEQLARVDEQLAQIVELRFFASMTIEQIAAALDVSPRSVDRGWRLARAWWIDQFDGGTSE